MKTSEMESPEIVTLDAKQLVGVHRRMSLASDATPQMWQSFMPRRQEISRRVNDVYISMRCYDSLGDEMFLPQTEFEKWAAVEVHDCDEIPPGMEAYTLSGGLYAMFLHRGPARTFPQTMQYIFASWLPASTYSLDHREQFEVLKENYDPMDESAEEEVWIPIK